MAISREERLRIHATIPPRDLRRLKHDLNRLDKKTWKAHYRKATRRAQRIHIIPFIRKATPDGSGKRAYGRKSMLQSGLRQMGGDRLSSGTFKARKSTGALRRDFKVKAMKRSRKITGNSTVNFKKTIFYGRLLEMGRTFNLFMKMERWRMVSPAQKKKLWQPGRWMWLNAAKRREPLAERATLRYLDEAIKREDLNNKNQINIK